MRRLVGRKLRETTLPVVNLDAPISEAIKQVIESPYRAALVVTRDMEIEGVITVGSIAKYIAFRWKHGVEPHDAINDKVANVRLVQPALVAHHEVDPLSVLLDILAVGVDFVVVEKEENVFHAITILDALEEARRSLYGFSCGLVTASQRWWMVTPRTKVWQAFMHLSVLPTWRVAVVNEANEVVGVYSATDFLRALLEGQRPYSDPVSNYASRPPIVVDWDTPLDYAVEIMRIRGLYALPVVRGAEGFVGMITARDIAAFAAVQMLREGV